VKEYSTKKLQTASTATAWVLEFMAKASPSRPRLLLLLSSVEFCLTCTVIMRQCKKLNGVTSSGL